jgi:hypothetical protein
LGIHAFYLDRSGEQSGDFILRDLRELEEKLAISTKFQAPNNKQIPMTKIRNSK